MLDGWKELSDNVIMMCCIDYAEALVKLEKVLAKGPPSGRDIQTARDLKRTVAECEIFFRGRWAATICPDVDGRRMMEIAWENRYESPRRWRMIRDGLSEHSERVRARDREYHRKNYQRDKERRKRKAAGNAHEGLY